MSWQFGIWSFDGAPLDEKYLERCESYFSSRTLGTRSKHKAKNAAVYHQPLHVTAEAWDEVQPHLLPSGEVLTWDGRLDNRAELVRCLGEPVTVHSTDLEIAAAAYGRWGSLSFSKLLGDWAMVVCNATKRHAVLARDVAGIRQLYYRIEKGTLSWSTALEPLVLSADGPLRLSEEYIAGWLSRYPETNLTPYVGIQGVPACSVVVVGPEQHSVSEYWRFDPNKRISYSDDRDYEEHFRQIFRESVRRRLRSDSPVTAELSGGMDSSSVVCMADDVIRAGEAETIRLDTVSVYDDSEPNWDERAYFAKVEERRGRIGTHIDLSSSQMFASVVANGRLHMTPGSVGSGPSTEVLHNTMRTNASRVLLSGLGGDEVMGGVPTPIPELEDLLARGHLRDFAHFIRVWALEKRLPWVHLLREVIRPFLPGAPSRIIAEFKKRMPWIDSAFVARNRIAIAGYESRVSILGHLPSFQANLSAFHQLRRQIAAGPSAASLEYDKCYPYLDRDLLEFIFAIPRSQLVRPGTRRSLMRRALVGLVPNEILERKRKAFVARSPTLAVSREWEFFSDLVRHMVGEKLGIVDSAALLTVLEKARSQQLVPISRLFRTVLLEVWLRNVECFGLYQTNSIEPRDVSRILRPVSAEKT